MANATIKEIEDALIAKFITAWAAQTVYALPNQLFVPPVDESSWVRVSVHFMSGRGASLGVVGDRLYRTSGFVVIEVFVPKDKGTANAGGTGSDDLLEDAINIFKGIRLSTTNSVIRFSNYDLITVGDTGDGWYKQNVSHEFEYDTIS